MNTKNLILQTQQSQNNSILNVSNSIGYSLAIYRHSFNDFE